MITLITGLPGSGKSLYTLKMVNDLAIKDNRQVYYYGIPELTLNWILMNSPEDWINLPNGSIFVIDECQTTFRPRANGSLVPKYVSEFETHRHKGFDAFLITQHPMLIDGNVRRLVGRHFHVVRFYGFAKSKIHEFGQVRDNVDKSTKNSMESHFVYPKEIYNWYKSADVHTVKKRVPMRLIMMFILPLVLFGVLYYGYLTVNKITKPDQIENLKQNGDPLASSLPINQNTVPPKSFVQTRTPEIKDLPFTAPVYNEVIKPVVAPYPAACVVFRNKCTCYTQQGTKLDVSILTCNQIVNDGFFVDWDIEPKTKQKSVSSAKVTYAAHDEQQFSSPEDSKTRSVYYDLN